MAARTLVPADSPSASPDSMKEMRREQWQKATANAKKSRFTRLPTLGNLAKEKEKDPEKYTSDDTKKGKKDDGTKKAAMFASNDSQDAEKQEDNKDNATTKDRWKRVSLWAKVGFPAAAGLADKSKSRMTLFTQDAMKAVQKVRLWREAEDRSLDCSKYRFRAKLARRMVYALAKEFIDDEHEGDTGDRKRSIKEIFHAIAVGVRQVLLMNRVANIFMALVAEMQIRERLASVSRELCQTQDWRKFKERLMQVKKEMHEAMDNHREMVNMAPVQEQIGIVQELVQKQEVVCRKSVEYRATLKSCEAFLTKVDASKRHAIQENEESAEKLWKSLMEGKKGLQEASDNAWQLQQAISMWSRRGHDEGSGQDVDSEESAERDISFLSSLPPDVKEKLIKVIQEMGTDSSEAKEICTAELEALGASPQAVTDTFAALCRLAWRDRVKRTTALLHDEDAESSLDELQSKMNEIECSVPESIKQQFPESKTDRKKVQIKMEKVFAKNKLTVPSQYRKMSMVGEYSAERRHSRHAFALAYLQRTRDVLAHGSAAPSRRSSFERLSPSPRISEEAVVPDPNVRLSNVESAARHRFSLGRQDNADDLDDDSDSESDKEESDKEDSDKEESDKQEEADSPTEAAASAHQEDSQPDRDQNSAIRVDVPGFQIRKPSRRLLEVPGKSKTSSPSTPSEESEVVSYVPVLPEEVEEVEDDNVAHESDQKSEIEQTDKHEASELPQSETSDGGSPHGEDGHIHFDADIVQSDDKASSAMFRDANEHWIEEDGLDVPDIEPLSSDEVLNALEELRQKVNSTFQGIDEAANELARCGGDVGGGGMVSVGTLHKRLQEDGYKRGLAEVCTLFRALGLTWCTEETTIRPDEFSRLGDIQLFYEPVPDDAPVTEDFRKLFSAVQVRRVLMDTVSEDEFFLSAVAIALSTCKDAAAAAGVADADTLQSLLDSMDRCFESMHGPNGKQFAANVLSKLGLRILTDVIACSDVSKEIRVASVILISESLAYHGFPPCSVHNEDFRGPSDFLDNIMRISEDFLMQELWRPLLNIIDPEGPGPPQPLDPQLLEQVFLLLLQVHMPSWILGAHGSKLAAELSLALRKLHACPLEAKALLRALRTFRIFEEDKEALHTATEWHTLAAALGGCRLLREQLALLHAHEEADVEFRGHGASATFARQGDHVLRLWRAARERLFMRWPLLRQTPGTLQKLQALVQAARTATSQGLQAAEPLRQRLTVEIEKEKSPPTDEKSPPTDEAQDKDDSALQAVDQDMDPIFLAGSVETEAVFRLEQRWKLEKERERQRLVSYDWSRPSIPPLAQATRQSQAYLTRNGVMPLPMLPPKSSQGKRHKKKQESGQQKVDGVHVMMLSSGPPLLCKTSRAPSRSTPRAGRSLQPLPESQVRTPWAWDEVPGQPTRRVQTANGGFRSREMPWTVQDEPRERSRPCTTGKLGIEDMAVSRVAWQVQNGPAWRSKPVGHLPALDHFPEVRQVKHVRV